MKDVWNIHPAEDANTEALCSDDMIHCQVKDWRDGNRAVHAPYELRANVSTCCVYIKNHCMLAHMGFLLFLFLPNYTFSFNFQSNYFRKHIQKLLQNV